jgi:hypothetical protein
MNDIPMFYNERQYSKWFQLNLEQFGYSMSNKLTWKKWKGKMPDLLCKRIDSDRYDVLELEMFPSRFIDHKHHIDDVDWIYCAEDNRIFYPNFPKEISAKLKFTNTKTAICYFNEWEKEWSKFEDRCKEYINYGRTPAIDSSYRYIKNGSICRMTQMLTWFHKDKRCVVCEGVIPIRMSLEDAMKHVFCVETLIEQYQKMKGEKYEHLST